MKPIDHGRKKQGVSTTKLVLGAAGLFLFIVGIRKTFRPEEGESFGAPSEPAGGERKGGAGG